MWEVISKNPQFLEAFGGYMTEDTYNLMSQDAKDNLSRLYSGSVGTPSPVLDTVPTGYEDYSVQDAVNAGINLNTNPVLSGDMNLGIDPVAPISPDPQREATPPQTPVEPVDNNQGFLPVTVNAGQSNAASLLYNPQTGGVRANGMAGQILLQNEKHAQELARAAFNQSLQKPVDDAAKNMETATGILESVPGDPSGDLLNVYNNAKSGLAAAQASADQNFSAPDAVTMVGSRVLPQTKTPTMTGLEALEVNTPVLSTQAPVEPKNPALDMPGYLPHDAMQVPKPVLVDTTEPEVGLAQPTVTTTTDPILRSGGQGRSTGALSAGSITSSSGPKTSNARGSMMPTMLVDRNEALIRIGGAMYSGSLKGDGIGAATQEYGRIQDANREQARKMAEAEQKRQMELAKLRARRAGGGGGGTLSKKDDELLSSTNSAMTNYQDALQAIRESRAAGGNLTGIGGIAKSLFDNFTGDADSARRLILERVKVDDALLRVAETKGAISNAEMKLFLAPAPNKLQDEAIWERWILDRMEALQRVQQRLSQSGTVPLSQRPTNQTFNSADFTIEEVKP